VSSDYFGFVLLGQVKIGYVRLVLVMSGLDTLGQVSSGYVRLCQVRSG